MDCREKVSVITVVYNDIDHLQETINSCFSQTWPNLEYLIIDGGSTDGTKELIEKETERLAYWVSERDGGIFDAMNKGAEKATGAWICYLNSGDVFDTDHAIEDMMTLVDHDEVDVLYAHSRAITSKTSKLMLSSADVNRMKFHPIYRHGSSLVRRETQLRFSFKLDESKRVGYGLDWEMIHRMYLSGCIFRQVDCVMERYKVEGTSNHQIRNRWYNYLITSGKRPSASKFLYFLVSCILYLWNTSGIYRWVRGFFMEWMINSFFSHIPFWCIRKKYLHLLHAKIGHGSMIMKHVYIMSPNRLHIGEYSHINYDCILDARGGITIGNSVSISHRVNIMTGSHDYRSQNFRGEFKPIVIDDYVWLGVGCTVLQGVHIGRGAVVCAGAVVTHDVPAGVVVGGIPAKQIAERIQELSYKCEWNIPFC